jgi:hypothetical protein
MMRGKYRLEKTPEHPQEETVLSDKIAESGEGVSIDMLKKPIFGNTDSAFDFSCMSVKITGPYDARHNF